MLMIYLGFNRWLCVIDGYEMGIILIPYDSIAGQSALETSPDSDVAMRPYGGPMPLAIIPNTFTYDVNETDLSDTDRALAWIRAKYGALTDWVGVTESWY